MKLTYLFIKILNPEVPPAFKLMSEYRIIGSYYFEATQGKQFRLQYNSLFEKDGEYSAHAFVNPDKGRFEFKSDYWNMLPHYLYKNNGVVIMSNDPLKIVEIAKAKIGLEAVYDCLIFGRPYKAGSYFENVIKLPPCKYGYINLIVEDTLVHSTDYPFWRDLLDDYKGKELVRQLKEDFLRAKENVGDEEVLLQFSGGSDSTTIFNALKFFKFKFQCASFSKSKAGDKRISDFCRRFSIDSHIYNALENGQSDTMAIELSAGTAPTSRFTSFYSQIRPSIMFDGYNICKGDYSDASIHPALRSLWLMEGLSGIRMNYPELPFDLLKGLYDYWLSNYSDTFADINTPPGLTQFQNYAMNYVIPIINGGINMPAIQMGHSVQSYYLTLPFILGAFNSGSGIARTVSIRNDYPGYRQSLALLAKINRDLDKGVYEYVMDRNLSFREIEEWKNHHKLLYYSRMLKKKMIRAVSRRSKQPDSEFFELSFFQRYGADHTSSIRLRSLDMIFSEMGRIIGT